MRKKPNIEGGIREIGRKSFEEEVQNQEIPKLENKYTELEKAYENIRGFEHVKFLNGAKTAFERIIELFNEKNKDGLKKLLTKDVYKSFCEAIDSKTTTEAMKIVQLEIELIERVWLEGKKIFITIVYSSKQIDNLGENQITKKDVWTFEKDISNPNPNWLLSST